MQNTRETLLQNRGSQQYIGFNLDDKLQDDICDLTDFNDIVHFRVWLVHCPFVALSLEIMKPSSFSLNHRRILFILALVVNNSFLRNFNVAIKDFFMKRLSPSRRIYY